MSTTIKLTLAGLAVVGACASAQEQEGMVVVRDSQTGVLRNATPAEVNVLKAQESRRGLMLRQPEPSPVVIRKDGSMQKRLGDQSMVYSVVTRDAAGKLGMHCVSGASAADEALNDKEPGHENR